MTIVSSVLGTHHLTYRRIGFPGGTYKVRNEIETKRNETKSTKTKRNEMKRNQQKRNETKRNEINEMKTK